MAKPRIAEVRLVASLLDPDGSGGEDAMALAREICEALEAEYAKREIWVVVNRVITGTPVVVNGPFPTRLKAEKYLQQLPFNGYGQHKDVGGYAKLLREPIDN